VADLEVGSRDWWLDRLSRRLADRQERYRKRNDWAIGNHPLPDGDQRYVKALRQLQKQAQTNYVGLAINAVTQRMKVRGLKIRGEVDEDAKKLWKANEMEYQAPIAIHDAARLSDTYGLVSPPDDDSGIPIITIEDPTTCIVEPDPMRPLRSLAGLKIYEDPVLGKTIAILYLPNEIHRASAPLHTDLPAGDRIQREREFFVRHDWEWEESFPNPFGEVPLVRGVWQPATELAECEGGGFEIQARINHTTLNRLIISKHQAYKRILLSGVERGAKYDPGADAIWFSENDSAKAQVIDETDIKPILEAIRDDVGDFAATVQTPVSYLTNKLSNVNGDTLYQASVSFAGKVKNRMNSMGLFFERLHRIAFKLMAPQKADEPDMEIMWDNPEIFTLVDLGDFVAKFAAVPGLLRLALERAGFTNDEIEMALQEAERVRQEEMAMKEKELQAKMQRLSSPPQEGTSNA